MKFFATRELLELAKDDKWLHGATLAIHQHWSTKNAHKKERYNGEDLLLGGSTTNDS